MTDQKFKNLISTADSLIKAAAAGRVFGGIKVPAVQEWHSPENQHILFTDRCVLEIFIEYGRRLMSGMSPEEAGRDNVSRFAGYRKKLFSAPSFSPDNPFFQMIKSSLIVRSMSLLLTHSCQLRCSYCAVGKYNADTPFSVIKQTIDSIASSGLDRFHMQFFGGEPFLRFQMMKKAVSHIEKVSGINRINFSLGVNSNGVGLDEEKISFCMEKGIKLYISCDGTEETCSEARHTAGGNYHKAYMSIAHSMETAVKCKANHTIIMVVMPDNLDKMLDNYRYLKSLGNKDIQCNYALGMLWEPEKQKIFAENLLEIQKDSVQSNGRPSPNFFGSRMEPVALNSEMLCDCDGGLYRETGVNLESRFADSKRKFFVAEKATPEVMRSSGASKPDSLWKMLEVYGHDKKFLKVIMNNLEFGMYLNSLRIKEMSASLK